MRLLLIDYSQLLYRALHVHKDLYFEQGYTGGLYGVLQQIITAIKRTEPDCMLVMRDARPYRRSRLYKQYKADRLKVGQDDGFRDRFRISTALCTTFFDIVGIPQVEIEGLESDDLIALVTANSVADEVIAFSTDTDLYQLYSYRSFSMYMGAKGLFTRRDMEASHFPGFYNYWVDILCLAGTHNNIQGVPQIGLKRASRIAQDDQLLEQVQREHRDIVNRNLPLVQIPFGGEAMQRADFSTMVTQLKSFYRGRSLDTKNQSLRLFSDLGFTSLVADLSRFYVLSQNNVYELVH